jgi:hypothetical protein
MDPIANPYAPGAGSPPPELAGRDAVREKIRQSIERLRRGKPAKSLMLVGIRGVGKTVLLDQMTKDAEAGGVVTIRIEAPEGRSLPALLAPQLRLGLPQLRGKMGEAKSYSERLFDFPIIGRLDAADAANAFVIPARGEGVDVEADAVALIVSYTKGYPYFLQEWGKHAWDLAADNPIKRTDVEAASSLAIAALDESFFGMRFDRLTPAEKKYLRAMAELGPGPHRSGDIAARLGRESPSLGPLRSSLISKGMVWSPTHGDTAFTVPLFDEFMKRIMPGDDWARADT